MEYVRANLDLYHTDPSLDAWSTASPAWHFHCHKSQEGVAYITLNKIKYYQRMCYTNNSGPRLARCDVA